MTDDEIIQAVHKALEFGFSDTEFSVSKDPPCNDKTHVIFISANGKDWCLSIHQYRASITGT